jgi:release factor glutamine methyltransferase
MENLTAVRTDAGARQIVMLLRHSARRLAATGIDSGPRDAEVLLGHTLGVGREQLIARADELIEDRQSDAYERRLLRRLAREPVAYITGVREFWSLEFLVTPHVLIPRPETELLVEVTLELARQRQSDAALRIMDIGTGSGAIAVALASELGNAEVFATDISARALAVARINAERHFVAERIHFVLGDLFDALPAGACFDVIVSNPPYICRSEIAALAPEVSRWEPRLALDGGADGLGFYRRIAAQAFDQLSAGGVLLVEIGDGTGETVKQIFQDAPGWRRISIFNDYAGRQRVVKAHKMLAVQ